MTEQPTPLKLPPLRYETSIQRRAVAGEVADKLNELLLEWMISECDSPRLIALCQDTVGLLRGLQYGAIDSSQQRIRDNFVEMIEMTSTYKDPDRKMNRMVTDMFGFLAQVSAAGLTAQNNGLPIESRSRQR